MNHRSRPRRAARLAAATAAAALGAALLTAFGAAPAQAAETPGDHFDYNGDGYQDLYTVRKSDGALLFSAGRGDETVPAPVQAASGWGAMDVVMAGDLTGDGTPDLLARDNRTGTLYTYPGDGAGGLEPRISAGAGWNTMAAFSSAGDFTGDGLLDIAAVRNSDGRLYLFPGDGDGTFGARTAPAVDGEDFGEGWAFFDAMTTVDRGTGPDLLLHSFVTGGYLHLGADGDGGFTAYGYYASSLYSFDDPTQFLQVTAAGDRNEDGYQDLVAVNRQSGELLLLEGDMYGNARYKTRLASAGTAHRLPATVYDHAYDYDQNYTSDLYAVRSAEPTDLSRYPGTGTGTFGPRRDHEYLIDGITLIETAGDMDGDWLPDLLIRYDNGLLSTQAGGNDWDQGGGITDVGTGWNKMSAILGGQDYTGDGKPDIVAREAATGYLWLYPGTGEGGVGSRVKIGTGWNAMRELTAVGDLDHDGHADLLAARTSDGCLYLYRGNGKGGFSGTVKVGCGWNKMNSLAAIGDADRDGHADLLARRAADGALILYKGSGTGGFPSSTSVGTGWNSIKFIA